MLAGIAEPFSRAGWIFELKYDGFRLLAGKDGDAASVAAWRDAHYVCGLEAELAHRAARERKVNVTAVLSCRGAGAVDPQLHVLGLELCPGARRVDAEVHALVVVAVEDAFHDARRPVQGSESRGHEVVAGLRPRGIVT